MNKPTFALIAAVAIVFSFSCKKTKYVYKNPVVYEDYTALKPGNYWVYQNYKLDSANGAAHALGTYDSCFVEKDTVINGDTFHKYFDVLYGSGSQAEYQVWFLRDSSGYTITDRGNILFSSTDFNTVFRTYTYGPNAATPDTLTITEQMGFKDATTVVDAGTFTTSTFRRIYHFPAGYKYGSSREYDFRYAKGIGLVSKTTAFYTATPELYERRLVRYKVQ